MKRFNLLLLVILTSSQLLAQDAAALFEQGNAAYNGGNYALAAAKVLVETDMSAEDIARKSIKVASDICVFTNNNVTVEKV